MRQSIIHVALVVRDYDEAIRFYCETLRFTLIEDTYQPEQDKRWVVVAPQGAGAHLLLTGHRHGPTLLGLRLGDLLVRFRLVGL